MSKRLYLSFFLSGIVLSICAQTSLFNCDFENGIPSEFSTFDVDGFEPSRGMKKFGFEIGKAWVPYVEESNGVAYSGSWYKEANQSNDWLVTPAIEITKPQAILSWTAHAIDANNPDGYAVYISEKSANPEDFESQPIYSVLNENTTLTSHNISLEKWAGKKIYIAFVNNSINCNLLALDDINVFYYDNSFVYISETAEAVSSPGIVDIKGAITTSGFLPVKGFKAVLSYNGEFFTQDFSNSTINQGETIHFDFSKSIFVDLDETKNYNITICSGDDDVLSIDQSISCFSRRVLIEEGTGNWCIHCPRGQYGLSLLREKYPQLIDVAVHINDTYSVTDYASETIKFFTLGIPHCVMDRNKNYVGDPYYDVEERYLKALTEGPVAKIECSASLNEDNMIAIKAISEFGKPISAGMYNLAFIVVEDNYKGLPQRNGYAGSSDDLGGFNKLTDPILNYVYANIGRAIFPSYSGDVDAFANETPQRSKIETVRQYELPLSISNLNEVKVIASIIENETGNVVNSAECHLDSSSGVEANVADNDIIINCSYSGNINVYSTANNIINSIEIFTIDGRCIEKIKPYSSNFTSIISPTTSLYIIKATTDYSTYTQKVKIN